MKNCVLFHLYIVQMAIMTLETSIAVSPKTVKVLWHIAVLFTVHTMVANYAVVVHAQSESHLDHEPQQQQSVPNGESGDQISYSDNELLPWYKDFLQLPSDGTLLLFKSMAVFFF